MTFEHTPVLLNEVLTWLDPQPGRLYVDATVGGGGHSKAIVERLHPGGQLIAADQDPEALSAARTRLGEDPRVEWVYANFAEIGQWCPPVTGGILADLGVSSHQLTHPSRGFTFGKKAALDMRMDPQRNPVTAAQLLNTAPEAELVRILREYGEERLARPIVRAILESRPLEDTHTLAELVRRVYTRHGLKDHRIHPATRTFQALRIAVNKELEVLEAFLPAALGCLQPGARLVVISFHSLEDRLVKRFFQSQASPCHCPGWFPVCQCGQQPTLHILTPKGVKATAEEVSQNPRSRSARLRAAVKV
jgi:16S rRNA (cytosine1402-N4)-methyltransferase